MTKVKMIEGYTFEDMTVAFEVMDASLVQDGITSFEPRIEEALRIAIEKDYTGSPLVDRIIETASIMLHLGIIMGENKRERYQAGLLH